MTTKTNEGGEILKGGSVLLSGEEAARFLTLFNGLPPAQRVEGVQLFNIGLSHASTAKKERDELVRKANARVGMTKADEAEVHRLLAEEGESLMKIVQPVLDENREMKKALVLLDQKIKTHLEEIHKREESRAANDKELNEAITALGKTAAWATPLKGSSPREVKARAKVEEIAVLEKALASATSEPLQAHLRTQIVKAKANL